MMTGEKENNKEKREPQFGFPFGCAEGMVEMMRIWCQSGVWVCDCCPGGSVVKDESRQRTGTE